MKKYLLLALCAVVLSGCVEKTDKYGNVIKPTNTPVPTVTPAPTIDPSIKVSTQDIKVGTGATFKAGDKLKVHYVGTLLNGTKFDSSRDRNQPFEFEYLKTSLITGWNNGIANMKVGGIRKITIPPELGYGNQAQNNIPANSTIVFEIELLAVN